MAKNAEIVVLTENSKYRERIEKVAQKYKSKITFYNSEKEYVDAVETHDRSDFIVMATDKIDKEDLAVMSVQAIKFIAPNGTIFVIAGKKSTPETAGFFKKSGVGMVLFEDSFFNESKLDFFYSQNALGDLVPVKSSEIIVGKEIPVSIYHILPLNNKILPIVSKGSSIDAAKLKKMNETGEFYIKRDDIDAYAKWIEKNLDGSAGSLKSRCRAQFLNLTITYKMLVSLLVDQGGTLSFALGKELMEKCRDLAGSLIGSLADVGDAWDVINLAAFSDYTPVDRSPAIAAYAGMISIVCELGNPKDVMVAAMMADLGLLDLSPEGALDLLNHGVDKLNSPSDKAIYMNHPTRGVNLCLDRRLPLNNTIKDIMLCVHELPSGKGFPTGKNSKIPYEAQLIRFCEMLDFENRVVFGKERTDPKLARKQMVHKCLMSGDGSFSPELMMKIKKNF